MEKRGKRVDCPALPPGWKKEEVIRKSGLSAGKSDVYYFRNLAFKSWYVEGQAGKNEASFLSLVPFRRHFLQIRYHFLASLKQFRPFLHKKTLRATYLGLCMPIFDVFDVRSHSKFMVASSCVVADSGPSGKKFRSKPQLARYLGNTVDLSSFDFRTGKMMPSKLQKNKQKLRNDSLSQNKGKPDLNTTLPIRQTASIFKQPVTKVTNHPNNKVKSDPQRVIEQPRQLFWEKRLQGLSASDVSEQIIKSMELPKGLQGVGPGNNDDTLLSAVASALHTSSAPITGQLSAAVEKNPAVWLNTSQPLCKAFIVTDEDIRKQEERVQQVRKKLEEALMADILSRTMDPADVDEVEMDNGEEA
ncbi:hypothetical protein Chor_008047 [Crotalus horridus]